MIYESLLGNQSQDENRNRLEAIRRIGGMWLRGARNESPRRSAILAMMSVVDDMSSRQEYSADALNVLGGVFCDNCRHIHPQISTLCKKRSNPGRDALVGCYLMGLAN